MAFCNKCGAQLEDNQRFCGKCGNDVLAKAAAAPAAAASAPAPVVQAAPPPQGYAAPPPPGYAAPPPQGYAAPGPMPVIVGAPPAQSKRGSTVMWTLIIVAAVLYGLYYIGTHNQQPGTNPTPAPTQPGQPGAAPQPGPAPGPAAPVQPGDPGPGGPNEALVQQQAFSGQWREANGYVQIYNAQWQNRSNETVQSASLECDQYDQNGAVLSQQRATLNGPVQPGTTWTANNAFNMGQIAQGLSKVNCGIVAVTPAQ